MCSMQKIGIGEPITDSYGDEKDYMSFFINYGFVMYPHPKQQKLFALGLQVSDQLMQQKFSLYQIRTQQYMLTTEIRDMAS